MTTENPSELRNSLNRFSSILSKSDIQAILEIQEQPLPTGIRLNSLKVNPSSAIKAYASRYGWQVEPIIFCDNGWIIQSAEISPGKTIEHRMGEYYLQDAASMVPVSLFSFSRPDPLILDMASSPGGKTTHLIDRTADKGFVIANDASAGRIPALRSVLTTWGGINKIITQFPGESFGRWFPETFDQVLLDAPCSMENLRPTPNHPERSTTTDERSRLQTRQIELLVSGLCALKTGGQMIYATCSLAPEEDEAVLDAILESYPGAITIEDVSEKFRFQTTGLSEFKGQHFLPATKNALRLWPHLTGMSGFFCALLTKNQPISLPNATSPQREFSKTNLIQRDQGLLKQISDQIRSSFGLDLDEVLVRYQLRLFTRFNQLFLIPGTYLEQFSFLPYAYIGMPIGKWDGQAFEPSFEFVSRFGYHFTSGKILISESFVEQWVSGRDIRYPETMLSPEGQYLMVTDPLGRNLGLGRLLPKRLRNLLPRQSV